MSDFTRRQFLRATAGATGSLLLSPRIPSLAAEPGGTPPAERVSPSLRPFPMNQVVLGEGPLRDAREANLRYLRSLAPDRLLHTFRRNAGLSSSAEPLGGWEAPECELRGHFAGGHYLSACALAYATTGDEGLKASAEGVVAGLQECQRALRGGYLSAFPVEFFDRLRAREKVWAPFYTLHKILAGHLDLYVHCGSTRALDNASDLADWVYRYTRSLSDSHMQRVLGTEFGGMGEALANLYALTGKDQHLETARRFDHRQFLEPLAEHRDELRGLHVNTQIPKVIAAARIYEILGEASGRRVAEYFWEEVVGQRAYCTGGTSNDESWNTGPGQLKSELGPYTTECCCAYNMMKLTRHLFAWSGEARFMDYYERLLFNHRLGTIHPEEGTSLYYLPLASGYFKLFGAPFSALWCCSGTAAEEFAKLSDTIYYRDEASIYVNLFVASEVSWPGKGVRLRQETRFPEEQGTTLKVFAKAPTDFTIHVRIPYWVKGGNVAINGAPLLAFSSPTSYLSLKRTWKDGDTVRVNLPMALHPHPMPDDPKSQAVLYGPLVLAGRFDPVRQMRGEYGPEREDRIAVPSIGAEPGDVGWVEPSGNLTFRARGHSFPLVPLYRIVGERYAVYWSLVPKGASGSGGA